MDPSAATSAKRARDDPDVRDSDKRTRSETPINLDGTEHAFPYTAFQHDNPGGPLPDDETNYIREEELDPDPMLQFGKFFAEVVVELIGGVRILVRNQQC